RRRRDAGVECRVEARDGGDVRERLACELDSAQRLRLVQRREVGEGLQAPQDGIVDHDGVDELGAAVHDAVADCIDAPGLGDVVRRGDQLVAVEDRELEAARPGVDDQDSQFGQTQFRTAGGSSPSTRVYARACTRSSSIRCRSEAACEPSDVTRSITSITRWKRSRSLSMTMSNGVVVVPSSLYPRTCRFAWFVRRYVRRWMSQG